jgi:hypothetical protein
MKRTVKRASREGRKNGRDESRQRAEIGKEFCRRRSKRGVDFYMGFDG